MLRYGETNKQVRKAIVKLYGEKSKEYERRYRKNRLTMVIAVVLVAIIAAIIYGILHKEESQLIKGSYIQRNPVEGSAKNIQLRAASSNGYIDEIDLVVMNRAYSETELTNMFQSLCNELNGMILPEGKTTDSVASDLNLLNRMDEYPFDIAWSSDNPKVISSKGVFCEEEAEKLSDDDKVVILTAKVTYEDFIGEVQIPVRVETKEKTEEEIFWEKVYEDIERLAMSSKTQAYQKLPVNVDGQIVSYSEKKDLTMLYIVFWGIVISILAGRQKDEKLLKKAELRDEQLKKDYPSFLNKIALYYGAGLPIKNVWEKICERYEHDRRMYSTNKRVVYEEMLCCSRKMKDGYTQEEAFEAFNKSVGITEYSSLIHILIQATRTGGAKVENLLKERRAAAFEEQKKNAKILGEKAGTKLLIPMFMMLSVVFIIILIPAFISF